MLFSSLVFSKHGTLSIAIVIDLVSKCWKNLVALKISLNILYHILAYSLKGMNER